MDKRALTAVRAMSEHLDVVTPADAALRGLGGADLRAACVAGELVRVRFGAYTSALRWQARDAGSRYRLRVHAAARALQSPLFSHDSAAVLWGLPRIGAWPAAVHVTVPHGWGGRSSAAVQRHQVVDTPSAVEVEGLWATSVARTVSDIARDWSFDAALVAADHALREQMVDGAALGAELSGSAGCQGTRRAQRVASRADGLSESVGESLSRARMIELGLPAPVLQHVVEVQDGADARVDFWWPHLGLVGEFDGHLKYRRDGVTDGRSVEERVWSEKLREDALRARGLRIARWTWDVAADRGRFADHLAGFGLHPA